MLKSFSQNYPAPNPESRSLVIALLFGMFIGLFLIFFEPFGINLSTNESRNFHLLFFGCITTAVLVLFLYILPLFLPNIFSDNNWKVKHQIIFYLIILFIIATCNGLYTNYINSLDFSWSNYWWIINRTFILGGIPISFLTILDYQRKNNLNKEQAQDILSSKKANKEDFKNAIHQFSTDLKNEVISFNEKDFIYALAVGNYIDLCCTEGTEINKTTFRVTLASFESQLRGFDNLARCHRSYLVNLKMVETVTGNAQGLKLKLKNQSTLIPVSRKYIPTVRQYFLKNHN